MPNIAILQRTSSGFQIASFLLILVGFVTPFWSSFGEDHVGLWFSCTSNAGCQVYKGTFPSKTTQAFAAMGLICSFVTFVMYTVLCSKRDIASKLTHGAVAMSLLSGMTSLAAAFIFKSNFLVCNFSCFFMEVGGLTNIVVPLVTLFTRCFCLSARTQLHRVTEISHVPTRDDATPSGHHQPITVDVHDHVPHNPTNLSHQFPSSAVKQQDRPWFENDRNPPGYNHSQGYSNGAYSNY